MKPATQRRHVYLFLTTDSNTRTELPVDACNRFMNDFRRRGGRAHAIVIRTGSMGTPSDVLGNLTKNTDGIFKTVAVSTSLKDAMAEIGRVVAGPK